MTLLKSKRQTLISLINAFYLKKKKIVPQPYSASIISLKRKNEVLKTILSLIFFINLTEFK